MRIIVVDGQTDRICGDIADAETTLPAPPNGDELDRSEALGRLCKAAARSVDGGEQGAYEFTCFAPCDKAPGYFVYLASEEGENCLHCEACPANLAEVFTHCFYVGHVHRRPQ